MRELEEEKPKYKKKKQSNISKSRNKSKHKHQYCDCLFRVSDMNKQIWKGTYCVTCGKINEMRRPLEKIDHLPASRFLSDEEILEKYEELPLFEINEVFQKYVQIAKKE